jgi:hypothetical protein
MEVISMTALSIGFTFTLMISGLLWMLFRKALSPAAGELDPKVIAGFSISDYRPLHRLLDRGDLRFLESQTGYEDAIGQRLMAARRQVFRRYLHQLEEEFQMLHRAARILVVHAPSDQSALNRALFKQALLFWKNRAVLRGGLVLHWLGMNGVRVDPSGLIAAAGQMKETLNQLIPQSVREAA